MDEEPNLKGGWQALLYRFYRPPFDESHQGLSESEGDDDARCRSLALFCSSDSYMAAKLGPLSAKRRARIRIGISMTEFSSCATTDKKELGSSFFGGTSDSLAGRAFWHSGGLFRMSIEVFIEAMQNWRCALDGG